METSLLETQKKETLHQWLGGHLVKDVWGNSINHRIWFKNIFNPLLRAMGWLIVTRVDDMGNVDGYEVRKYKE